MDLIIENKDENGKIGLRFFYNYFLEDVFRLKTLGVDNENYGMSRIGVNYQFIFTTLDGDKEVNGGSQMFQNGYQALQLPYSFFGIGRSNNYIEHLTVAYSLFKEDQKKEWSPIIPNSQIIIQAHNEQSDE
jgi:integrin alpha FG-GAP repeat containing protein 1